MLLNRHRVKTPVIEQPEPIEAVVEAVIDYEAMTKNEVIEALKKTGVEFDGRQKKEELIELLKAGK